MDELVKSVDPHFEYESHVIDGGVMRLYAHSTRKKAVCSYCVTVSGKVHGIYFRKFRLSPVGCEKNGN